MSESRTAPSSSSSKRSHADDNNNLDEAALKYARGAYESKPKHVKHKSLRETLKTMNDTIKKNATLTASTEILLPEEAGYIQVDEGEKVYKLKQNIIKQNVDINTSTNLFDFQLTNFGPYHVNYSRNGRSLLFGGRRGHVASIDSIRTTVGMELQLQEDVYDICYLHNETMFAVAQKKYTYIYDQNGVEIHCLRKHERPYKLDYLPYHFLLTSIGQSGYIRWQDVSTGALIGNGSPTGHGPCKVLKHNPHNAVSHLGHSNGVVTLWSPASSKALVSMFCHKAPVTDLAVDLEGKYMVTAGLDTYLKVWDLRTYRMLHCYKPDKPVVSIDISDRAMIAIGLGREVQILKNAFTQPMDVTYLKHEIRAPNRSLIVGNAAVASKRALLSSVSVHSVKFRPYEDSLAIGHSHGITSIIVPGSGEPNFDSYENNPYITTTQRREQEVQTLLNKLAPEMIGLGKFPRTILSLLY